MAITTFVYRQPKNDADRTRFNNGLKQLASDCKATWIAGSHMDEISYVEILEKALARETSDMFVEDIRQEFERKSRGK